MRIHSYHYKSHSPDHQCFSTVAFNSVNLLVGDSGMGKSRFLNTLFNAGASAIQKTIQTGQWDIVFSHQGVKYRWLFDVQPAAGDVVVQKEKLEKHIDSNQEPELLVERNQETFYFLNKLLPKLSRNESSISLLQEEDEIQPIYDAFSHMLQRDFSGPTLTDETTYKIISPDTFDHLEHTKNISEISRLNVGLSGKLFFLQKNFKAVFQEITNEFRQIFPFVSNITLKKGADFNLPLGGNGPVFALQESGFNHWVPIWQFSSGMKKVLLILTDLALLPDSGGIYLLDEYENSLGISAINLFPSSFLQFAPNSQLILTSHHPYIINQIPVKDWFIFHRKGTDVKIKYGHEVEERFGKSKQQAFIQLLNDKFYNEGID